MAFKNGKGESISYECAELIQELTEDAKEFGGNVIVNVWCREINGVTIYTNYDFVVEESPVEKNELEDDEYIEQMSTGKLLPLLKKQNEIY